MRFCYYFSRILIRLILELPLRFKFDIRGQEFIPKKGPLLLICNHLSHLDPLVLGINCPRRLNFLARQNLFALPVLGIWMKSVGVIAIRRDIADLGAIKESMRRLKQGEALAVFPEGSRQQDPSKSFREVKKGFLLLAKKTGTPVVVAKIYGSESALPKGERKIRRASRIKINFSEPFTIGKNQDYDDALAQLNQVVADL